MKVTPGGFTIVEVMIVLAISGLLLGSAAAVFSGRRQSTEFSQAMYDLQSEIQSIANNVSSQLVPGFQQYTCVPTSVAGKMRPVLAPGSSTGKDCIYLGQALQVAPNSPTLYSYPVFGLRTIYDGAVDTGNPPSTLDQANPEPAISSSDPTDPNNLQLITTYPLLNGLQVSSAQFNGTENDYLILYSSLQDNNTSGNEISVLSANYSGGSSDPKAQLKECIESSGCPAFDSWNGVTATPWKLCLTDGSRQALLSLKGTPTGIVTNLNLNGCS